MHTYRARTLETGVDTHSDIGFQLAQFPGKWRWNGKVAESVEKYCLTKVSQQAQMKAAISGCRAEGNLETCFGVVA